MMSQNFPNTLWRFIWYYLRNKKLCLVGFVIVAFVWAFDMSFVPYLLKVMLDRVSTYSHDLPMMLNKLIIPSVLYVFISVVLNFNFRFVDYINLKLYPWLKSTIIKDMFSYLMGHSYSYFQNSFSGSLTKKIFDMAMNVEFLVSIPNVWFYPRLIALIVSATMLFFVVHPLFSLILIVWAIGFAWMSYAASKTSEKLSYQFSNAANKMDGVIVDSVSNVLNTKLFATAHYENDHLNQYVNELKESDQQLQWQTLRVHFVQGCGATILIASMLVVLIYGRLHSWISVGDFGLVLMLLIAFINSTYNIGQEMVRFSKVVGTCKQALTLLMEPHEIIDLPYAREIEIARGEILFKDVSFAYEQQELLFDHLNIEIKSGEKVGLVGYSGGGKSTFFKLILRLVDISSGFVLIDGDEIKSFKKDCLRTQISTIPQEPNLFHRSIMDNIRIAKPGATEE